MQTAGNKTILVAGGAGFLGIALCRSLLQEGHTVICLDNYSSGSRRNIEHLSDYPGFKVIDGDIADPIDAQADQIYNMACVASPGRYQLDPLQTMRTNVQGVGNLLELAQRIGARFLQSSTSEVYGNPAVHPQTEDYLGNVNPLGPRACYDEGKRCAETLCMDYHRLHQLEIKIARIFNTYGPYMQPHDGRVVSNFIVQALLNQPITLYGDGSQTRSLCFVDDLIIGLKALMASAAEVVGPINLGNPNELTVLELALKIIELTGSKSKVIMQPLPEDDPCRRRPDITRAQQFLNWQPRVPLDEGLGRTINYFEQLLQTDAELALSVAQTAANASNGQYLQRGLL